MTLFAAKTKRQAEPAEPQTRPRRKLTRAERKQIEAAIARANRTGKKEQSAQDSIPYERMWPDGICKVADGRYTKTIQFQDINYQLSQNEDKTAIFEGWCDFLNYFDSGWCDFLNYFDSSIRFQLSFLNLAASQETFANSITIPAQGDDFDPIRVEYTQMLQNQLARGNNGLIKTKYLTFSIEADSIRSGAYRDRCAEQLQAAGRGRRGPGRQSSAGPAPRHLPHGRAGALPVRVGLAGSQRSFHQRLYCAVRL